MLSTTSTETPDLGSSSTSPNKVDVTYVIVQNTRVDRVGNEWPAVGGSDGGGVVISGPDHHGFI